MKNSKLVLLSCLSLCVSQVQAMEGKMTSDITTNPADHITRDATAEAKKDAARRSQAQHEQSGQPVDPTFKEDGVDKESDKEDGVDKESEPTQRVSKPTIVDLSKANGDETVINEPKEETPTEDTIYRSDVENKPVLFEDLTEFEVEKPTSQSTFDSVISSVKEMFNAIGDALYEALKSSFTPSKEAQMQEMIKEYMADPTVPDNFKTSLKALNEDLNTLGKLERNGESKENIKNEYAKIVRDLTGLVLDKFETAAKLKDSGDEQGANLHAGQMGKFLQFLPDSLSENIVTIITKEVNNNGNTDSLSKFKTSKYTSSDRMTAQKDINSQVDQANDYFKKMDQLKKDNKNDPEKMKQLDDIKNKTIDKLAESMHSSDTTSSGLVTALRQIQDPVVKQQVIDKITEIQKKNKAGSVANAPVSAASLF